MVIEVRSIRRRALLVLPAAWLAGCAQAPAGEGSARSSAPSGGGNLLSSWRSVNGGFLAPPGPVLGIPARPGTGMFVRLIAPTALALRGSDLLVVDSGAGRLWRLDLGLNTIAAIAGAPTAPGTAVAISADLSAWVLDTAAAQVLRFARDGRLLQTFRAGAAASAPASLALGDGGATLLLADRALPRWAELRGVGAIAVEIRPEGEGDGGPRNVDAIALVGDEVLVLDRLAAVVWRVQRDGRVRGHLGDGALRLPTALAADRQGRVFVVEASGQSLVVLAPGEPPRRFEARELGVVQVGGIAVDERLLAVADRVGGTVVLHRIAPRGVR
jgi:hypothetical protein